MMNNLNFVELVFGSENSERIIKRVCQLEEESYPIDEAASEATIQYRLANATQYFRVFAQIGFE